MRRVISIILVMIMIPAIAFGGNSDRLEYIENVMDNIAKVMKGIAGKYEEFTDQFDADYVYIMYSYFKTWLSLRSVVNAELLIGIKENPLTGGREQFDETTRKLEQGYVSLEETVNEIYKQWLSGELSNEMFGGRIAALINAMVE